MLPALTEATAMNFTVHEVSADKGYASKANYESVARFGTVPFIVIATRRIRVRDLEERDRELGASGAGTWSTASGKSTDR